MWDSEKWISAPVFPLQGVRCGICFQSGTSQELPPTLRLPDVPCFYWDTLGSLYLIFWSAPLIKFKIQLSKRSVCAKRLLLMWLERLQFSTSAQQMAQEFCPRVPWLLICIIRQVAASKNLSVHDMPELTDTPAMEDGTGCLSPNPM